jgi:tetratricopeptide (TPR) repeat protein
VPAHFDNSVNNPNNPDPRREVGWGDQSRDEMMIGFFSVAVDGDVPLKSLEAERPKEAKPHAKSPKESDALHAFQDAQTPDQQLQAIENILSNFPDTDFKVMLLQTAMQIEQRKDDFGQAAGLRKKYDEAIAEYKQAISIAATPDAVVWVRLGQVYEDSGKLDEAADAFAKALATPNISPQVKSVVQAKKDEVAKRKGAGY